MSAKVHQQQWKNQYNSHNGNNNETVNKNKEMQKLIREMKDKEEYGLKEMKNAREKMEK